MEILKRLSPLAVEVDICGLSANFAAEVAGFGGLDDMELLMSSTSVLNGRIVRHYSNNTVGEDKTCGYITYLIDALLFLYDSNNKELLRNVNLRGCEIVMRSVKPSEYSKYIKKFYGKAYISDSENIKTAICQSVDFLMTAWKIIESNKRVEAAFKEYVKRI